MSLKDAFVSLKKGIADISSVEVQTFTGDLSTVITESNGESVLDWENLLKNATSDTQGSITLMASSKYEFDGDAKLLINPAITPEMREAHDAAVSAGLEVRQGLIDAFYDLIDVT